MGGTKQLSVVLELTEMNRLQTQCTQVQEGNQYKYYIYKDGLLIDKTRFTDSPENIYWLSEPGKYKVKVLVLDKDENKSSFISDVFSFGGVEIVISDTPEKRKPFWWFRNVVSILNEIWVNRKRMIRVAHYDFKIINNDTYLGGLWNVLNPFIQIFTYWFVFGIGIRARAPMGEYPFFIWMLCGLIPWFFINDCITRGAASIFSKGETILKFQYPTSTIPVGSIFVNFYAHLWTLGVLLIIMIIAGITPTVYWLNLIYYTVYAIIFLSVLALVTSVFTMIARDFQNLLQACMRLLFYITPILWSPDNLSPLTRTILKLNPIAYITDGFRDSLLYKIPFYVYVDKMIFFWALVIILLFIGSNLQMKFRDEYIDMM